MKSVLSLLLGLVAGANAGGDCYCMRGEMRLFYGRKDYIPKGFQLCDGTNYTPDMRDVFAIGATDSYGDYPIGSSGGASAITLAINNLPAHYHNINKDDIIVSMEGEHDHPASGAVDPVGDHSHDQGCLETVECGKHTHPFSTTSNAGGHGHDFDLNTDEEDDHTHPINFQSGQAGNHAHGDTFEVLEVGSGHDHEIKVKVDDVDDHSHSVDVDDFDVCIPVHNHGVGTYAFDNHVFSHGHDFDGETDSQGVHNHVINADLGKAGDHTHEFDLETDTQGDHTHGAGTLATDECGVHDHSIDAQDTEGPDPELHNHEVNGYFEDTYDTEPEYKSVDLKWDIIDSSKAYVAQTSEDGKHKHTVPAQDTNLAGAHLHDVKGKTGEDGEHEHDVLGSITGVDDHCHSIDISSVDSGLHYHDVNGNAADVEITLSHTLSGYSAPAGAYTADISEVTGSTDGAGAHEHEASAITTSEGKHDHELSGGVQSDGDHDHAIVGNTANSGKHEHTVSGSIGGNDDGEHNHDVSGTTDSNGNHNHPIYGDTGDAGAHYHGVDVTITPFAGHKHTVSGQTEPVGQGKPLPVIPPFQAVYYICCVGVPSSSSSSDQELSFSYVNGDYGADESDDESGNDYDKYVGFDAGY